MVQPDCREERKMVHDGGRVSVFDGVDVVVELRLVWFYLLDVVETLQAWDVYHADSWWCCVLGSKAGNSEKGPLKNLWPAKAPDVRGLRAFRTFSSEDCITFGHRKLQLHSGHAHRTNTGPDLQDLNDSDNHRQIHSTTGHTAFDTNDGLSRCCSSNSAFQRLDA